MFRSLQRSSSQPCSSVVVSLLCCLRRTQGSGGGMFLNHLFNVLILVFLCVILCPTVTCPPNAEYSECGPACSPSCQQPSVSCSGPCVSGCFCKPGYVLNGRRCVRPHTCGCLDEHHNYYEVRTPRHNAWREWSVVETDVVIMK